MAYIGRDLKNFGEKIILDSLTASATADYTLQLNSVDFVPSSASALTVSLNGVIQKPESSFTVSGATLSFSSALTTDDTIDFVIAERDILLQTPSAGSVQATQVGTGIINNQTAETSPALNDEVLIYDTSATALRKMTREKLVGCTLLQDQVTATSVSSVEIDLPSDYNWFKLVVHMSHPVTDGQDLMCRLSVNGSYISSSNSYSQALLPISSTAAVSANVQSRNTDQIQISAGVGNNTDEQVGGSLEIFPKKDSDATRGGNWIKSFMVNYNANTDWRYYEGGHHLWENSDSPIDGIRLYHRNGNIDKIIYSLYGFHS